MFAPNGQSFASTPRTAYTVWPIEIEDARRSFTRQRTKNSDARRVLAPGVLLCDHCLRRSRLAAIGAKLRRGERGEVSGIPALHFALNERDRRARTPIVRKDGDETAWRPATSPVAANVERPTDGLVRRKEDVPAAGSISHATTMASAEVER